MELLEKLNDAQKDAVKYFDGPMMVIAGAGSGKTRVLTYKIAHMIERGVDPFSILSLTFTNKAAREMKERIFELLGNNDARNVWMGTFHSIFARILRIEGHHLGYPSNFTIYDTDDSKSVVRGIVKDLNLDPKTYTPSFVLHRISSAKSSLINAREYNANPEVVQQDKLSGKPAIPEIFLRYEAKCKKASAMDFDDLLYNTNVLFRDFPEVLFKYQQKFKYVLVDEYQDTNYAQYLIVKKLAANDENICVVGDDAQSIYAFRGANIQNILNIEKDYPDLKIFKLEQNYRSTSSIVKAANSIIDKNKDQIKKTIWTENETGEKIKLVRAASDNEEGALVANSIFEHKMNHQLPNSDFAILYRTNAQSRPLEEALRKLNIPYRIYGGLSFYQRKEIKDLLAYFRLVINPNDEEAFNRIINYPARGIGKTTLERLTIIADQQNVSLWEVIENVNSTAIPVNAGIKAKLNQFFIMIKHFQVQLKSKNAFELGKEIAKSSGLLKNLADDKTPEGVSRYENIEELLNGLKEFSEQERPEEEVSDSAVDFRTLDEFMQEVALLTDQDNDDDDNNKVSLMTIHAAKGLEFPYVFIVGLEENLFPNIQALNSRVDLEEERRLFYVAVTRAEKKAWLSYAESRYRWGNFTLCEPSRFIEDIDKDFLDAPMQKKPTAGFERRDENVLFSTQPIKKKIVKVEKPAGQDGFEATPAEELGENMKVLHQRFGEGTIINMEGSGSERKALVDFNSVGQKKLLLKFAKLKKLD